MVKETAYYDLLNVKPDATESEIKKAFRKAAMLWHPDKHSTATEEKKKIAENKFKEIGKAYETLSDPEKRQTYDRFGEEALQGGPGGGQGPDIADILRHMSGMGMGMGMGGFQFRQNAQPAKEPQIPDLVCEIKLTLQEIYAGKKVEFKIARWVLREGAIPPKSDIICKGCRGMGQQMKMEQIGPGMMRQYQARCDQCDGGIIMNSKYFEKSEKTLKKTIPRGVIHSHQIVVPSHGHEIPQSMRKSSPSDRTDLIIVIKEVPDQSHGAGSNTYTRGEGGSPFNLQVAQDLEPELAICGGYKEMTFIDGSKFLITVPFGLVFKQSHTVVVAGRGMPVYGVVDEDGNNKYGDLFVKFRVKDANPDPRMIDNMYRAITGRSKKEDDNKIKGVHGGASPGTGIEDYADSVRLREINDDFRKFKRIYDQERSSDMGRRSHDNPANEPTSDSDEGYQNQRGGFQEAGCAQQ